jgi:hypothetical protein
VHTAEMVDGEAAQIGPYPVPEHVPAVGTLRLNAHQHRPVGNAEPVAHTAAGGIGVASITGPSHRQPGGSRTGERCTPHRPSKVAASISPVA